MLCATLLLFRLMQIMIHNFLYIFLACYSALSAAFKQPGRGLLNSIMFSPANPSIVAVSGPGAVHLRDIRQRRFKTYFPIILQTFTIAVILIFYLSILGLIAVHLRMLFHVRINSM